MFKIPNVSTQMPFIAAIPLSGADIYNPVFIAKPDYLDRKTMYDATYYTKPNGDNLYLIERAKGAVVLANDIAKMYQSISNDSGNILLIYDHDDKNKYFHIINLSQIDRKNSVIEFIFKKGNFEERESIKIDGILKILMEENKKLVVFTQKQDNFRNEIIYNKYEKYINFTPQSTIAQTLNKVSLTEPKINSSVKFAASIILFVILSNILLSMIDTSGTKMKLAKESMEKSEQSVQAALSQLETLKKNGYYTEAQKFKNLNNKEVYKW